MPSGIRLQRIADRVRQELSELLIREVNDPRLQRIFITDVKIDKELAFADIYVSAIEGAERSAEILAGLEICLWVLQAGTCRKSGTARLPKITLSLGPHRRMQTTSKRFWRVKK